MPLPLFTLAKPCRQARCRSDISMARNKLIKTPRKHWVIEIFTPKCLGIELNYGWRELL
jgi:hypothetical protein